MHVLPENVLEHADWNMLDALQNEALPRMRSFPAGLILPENGDGQTRFCSRTVHFYLQHVDADADAGIIFFHPSVFLFVHTPRCRGREDES